MQRGIRWKVRWSVVAALAVVLGGGLAGDAFAGKKKIAARINGKGFKVPGKFTVGAITGGGIIIAGAKPVRPGRLFKELTLSCVVGDLATATLPLTVTCGGAYLETKLAVNPVAKAWVSEQGIQMTIQSFSGIRLTGTFSGAFETPGSQNPADPPAQVQNGKVSVDLQGG